MAVEVEPPPDEGDRPVVRWMFASLRKLADHILAFSGSSNYAALSDTKTTNTAPAVAVGDAWEIRELNTEEQFSSLRVALVANEFILQPGKYRIRGAVAGEAVTSGMARLFNVTRSVVEFYGTSVPGGVFGVSHLEGVVVCKVATSLRVEHYLKGGGNFGAAANIASTPEKYLGIEIWGVE